MTCSARWEFGSRWSASSGACRTWMRSATTLRGSVDFSSSRVTRDSVACRESWYRELSVHGKSCGTSGTSQTFYLGESTPSCSHRVRLNEIERAGRSADLREAKPEEARRVRHS